MTQTTPGARPPAGTEGAPDQRTPVERARHTDMIRWGPILAGLVVVIALLTLMTVLGLALGLTADPVLAGDFDLGMATAIWGFVSAAIAFAAGGLVAGAGSSRLLGNGMIHGAMVGVTAIAAITIATAMGAGNLLGAGAANLSQIADIAPALDTEEAVQFAQSQTDDARIAAWGAFATLLGAVILAAVGGLLGSRSAAAAADQSEARH